MKLNGQELRIEKKEIVELNINNDIIPICVGALPIDFYETLEKKVSSPKPNIIGVIKDQKGNIVYDENKKVIPFYNDKTAEFIEKTAICNKRQATYILVEGLKQSEITFDTQEKDCSNFEEYLDLIYEELKESGITLGMQTKIINAINRASDLDYEIGIVKKN